jgi:hypothetical protein
MRLTPCSGSWDPNDFTTLGCTDPNGADGELGPDVFFRFEIYETLPQVLNMESTGEGSVD